MPKLRPINFERMKAGDTTEAWRMLKDLLMLYPRGAGQRHRKEEYYVYDMYRGKNSCLSAVRDAQISESVQWDKEAPECWGYTDVQVYTLVSSLGHQGTSLSEWKISSLLYAANNDGAHRWSQAKMTRSSHRLYQRLASGYRQAIKSGKLGDLMFKSSIRSIPVSEPRGTRWGWDESVGIEVCIPAVNSSEAKMMITTCFGHAIHPDRGYIGSPEGYQQGDATNAMLVNQGAVKSLTNKREYWLGVIAKAKEQIANIDVLAEAIEVYSLSAFGDE